MDARMTSVEFRQRRSAEGHPFTEMLFVHNGEHFCTRVPWVMDDTLHGHAAAIADFLNRRKRYAAQEHRMPVIAR